MNFDAEFDLTKKYGSADEIRAAIDLTPDAWAYVIDAQTETATVFAVNGTAFYGHVNATLVRTLDDCVNELGKLVGI